jgi:hypothetical protein
MLLFVAKLVIIAARDARSMPTSGDVITDIYYLGDIEISL